MESLERGIFDIQFLTHWHCHYDKLAAYLSHQSKNSLLETGTLDDELVEWIGIQANIKDKLPSVLRSKLAVIDFDEKVILWDHMYQKLAHFAQTNGHTYLPSNDKKYAGLKDWLLKQIQDKKYLSQSRFHQLNILGVDWEIAETRDQRWEQMYFKLKEFCQIFGHCQVPQKWEKDKTLANWVCVQRRMKVANRLRPERESRLNKLNFLWHIQAVYDSQWQHYYQKLNLFYQEHGHCRVPGENKQLTSWIENQRTAKKNNLLSADRERTLNEIGFIWNFRDIKRNCWDERYKQLCAFKQKYGHSFVPFKYKENKSLGSWVASQRKLESKHQLEEVKKKQLNQLDFVWSTDSQGQLMAIYNSKWALYFERLKIYKLVYGSYQVSLKINPELQQWVCWQRKLFYRGKLSEERLAKLNEIKFPWNIQEEYWMKMYNALSDFRNQFGHTRVPYQWSPNPQLAEWVYRTKLKKSEQTVQKVELLNKIKFDWELIRRTVVSWEVMYNRLIKFKQEYGHTRVPVQWSQDPKLGKWVSRMRQVKGNIIPERIAFLESIEFDWGCQFVHKESKLKNREEGKNKFKVHRSGTGTMIPSLLEPKRTLQI